MAAVQRARGEGEARLVTPEEPEVERAESRAAAWAELVRSTGWAVEATGMVVMGSAAEAKAEAAAMAVAAMVLASSEAVAMGVAAMVVASSEVVVATAARNRSLLARRAGALRGAAAPEMAAGVAKVATRVAAASEVVSRAEVAMVVARAVEAMAAVVMAQG